MPLTSGWLSRLGCRSGVLAQAPLALILLALSAVAWWPRFVGLASPGADQVASAFGIASLCQSDPTQLGWFGSAPVAAGAASLFAPGLLQPLLSGFACRFSLASGMAPLQAYLVLGLLLTAVLSFLSCRWAGLRPDTSLLGSFLLVTAPCSFSRIGHLELAVLIPVIPSLVACLQLHRCLLQPIAPLPLIGCGALAALLTFPSQDYYVAFSLLLLLASFALELLLASASTLELAPLRKLVRRGGLFLLGFLLVLVLLFVPKLLALGLPVGGSSGLTGGPPVSWATPRLPNQTFTYGLLPFTWVIPSPWVPVTLDALRSGWIDTNSESFFWSTGSLLIPISWILAIRRLAMPAQRPRARASSAGGSTSGWRFGALQDGDRRFLALLLLLASALGLLVMTMGGLGTLFAVFISPVLRSLNRFTAFVYGASVLYLLADFDLWLQRRAPNP
ncbi:MAG: hypothetical protein WCF98_07170 [Synechococcus sp. ELA057]